MACGVVRIYQDPCLISISPLVTLRGFGPKPKLIVAMPPGQQRCLFNLLAHSGE